MIRHYVFACDSANNWWFTITTGVRHGNILLFVGWWSFAGSHLIMLTAKSASFFFIASTHRSSLAETLGWIFVNGIPSSSRFCVHTGPGRALRNNNFSHSSRPSDTIVAIRRCNNITNESFFSFFYRAWGFSF